MTTPSQAIFDALFRLIDDTSAAHICARTELPTSTVSRWSILRRDGGAPSFNADSFDALMKLDEVRAALVARLRNLPDQELAAWEGIAAKLARIISPAVGWKLAALLHDLAAVDALDSDLSAIEGLIKARRQAGVEKIKADKLAARKGKSVS